MIKLNEGNVLLKPSHRRQLMGCLKRSAKLGERFGNFAITIDLHRTGRLFEVNAKVHHSAGDFNCHARQRNWRDALREIAHRTAARLHDQCVHGVAA
jgi:endonuclease/exonuclease/phosphatase family metal-dependent hydrolase